MFWLLFIFSSLRYGIGYDYFNYCEIIKKGDNFEPLSHILANIARKSHCIQIFFIINSFLAIYPIYYVAKRKSEDACFTLLMYYLWPILFLESLSIVRNASAYSFIFLAWYFIQQKKFLKGLIWVIVAGLFHYSGFVGIALFFFYAYPLNKKSLFCIFLISFIIGEEIHILMQGLDYTIVESPIISKLLAYGNNGEDQGRFMKYIIIFISLLNIVYWNRLVRCNSQNKILLNLACFGGCLWVMLSFDKTISLRISSFFLIFQILIIPSYINIAMLYYRKIIRLLILVFFITYFSSGFIINILAYTPNSKMSYIPYQTIFYHKNYLNYKSAK